MKKQLFFFVSILILLSAVFVSCSSGGGEDEDLVTTYSYNLEGNENYYNVYEYRSAGNGGGV